MILFIGTLFRFLHLVMLFTIITVRGPHRHDPGEEHQDNQGKRTGYIESLFDIGQLVAL
jgi:hypothetical protein